MAKIIKKEEVPAYIGYETEPTDWHTVTQEQINQFADCTLDHQFIHVDQEKAKTSPFGSTIAHGFLTMSMLSHFAESFSVNIEGLGMAINSGFDKVRFIAPVNVDSRIRARAKLIEMEEKKPGQYRVKMEVTLEIEGQEKPALIAEWIFIQFVG